MTDHTPVLASRAEADRTYAALVAAFVADPLVRWMLPEPHRYFTHFGPALEPFAGAAFDHGSAYRTPGFEAAALWLPPGVHSDDERMGAVIQEAAEPALLEEIFAFFELLGPMHPTEDHWYLPVIGVDPRVQGKGLGSALLASALAVIDQSHQVSYLESSNERNIPLYERHGFEVIGEIQTGSSPTIWPMVRSAR